MCFIWMFPAWNFTSSSDVNNSGFSIKSVLSLLLASYELSGPNFYAIAVT